MNTITLHSPAKINLCLSVLNRRPDGYHDVEMLMQMVGLADQVSVTLGGKSIRVRCDSQAVPSGAGNIAWKAAVEMLRLAGNDIGLEIEIKKNIPVAAGLGGGSGNAAAVLAATNRLLGMGLDRDQLAEIGTRIGMDVPFFFYGPTAIARGRGELLAELPPLERFRVLLVNPGFETSTAWVYNNVNLRLTKKAGCNKISSLNLQNIVKGLHNDLESVTAFAHPEINRIKQALLDTGAAGALMSGSGPTVFGVFNDEKSFRAAADDLSREGWQLYPVETLTESPLAQFYTG
jgi:4-diphosphocytidyl-2-C-methyl-D-erythritol kinase